MVREIVIFLDDGGVMNDNRPRSQQWQRLVGEFFAPRLGGTPDLWAAANRVVAERFFEPMAWEQRMRAFADYASFDRAYQIEWLDGMCEIVGVPTPAEAESVALAYEATGYVIPRVRSAFPGAVDAIRHLHARGFRLNTASGEPSRELAGYLEGMGVRACFDRLYGPDLIMTFKSGPAFYQRLLADAGVAPRQAVVIDDSPLAIGWAAEVGARTVLVGETSCADATAAIGSLRELPEVVDRICL